MHESDRRRRGGLAEWVLGASTNRDGQITVGGCLRSAPRRSWDRDQDPHEENSAAPLRHLSCKGKTAAVLPRKTVSPQADDEYCKGESSQLHGRLQVRAPTNLKIPEGGEKAEWVESTSTLSTHFGTETVFQPFSKLRAETRLALQVGAKRQKEPR